MTDRLDTGMKPSEAVLKASQWWDKWGRGLIPRHLAELKTQTVRGGGLSSPMLTFIKSHETDPMSGILAGKPFWELTEQERLQICKQWHHWHVRVPETKVAQAQFVAATNAGYRSN